MEWDGSFECPKQMFKLMDKKIFSILRSNFCPSGPMYNYNFSLAKAFAGCHIHNMDNKEGSDKKIDL